MSVNRLLPHVLVLPEDDANRQLAIGFRLDPFVSVRRMQVLPVAGGWAKVLESFRTDHVQKVQALPTRFMVLLIDFDGKDDRLDQAKAAVPDNLKDRVFVLGVWTEPEQLRAVLDSYEKIGLRLAKDCREGTVQTWGHQLLRHNDDELERLNRQVRPILFQ